MSASKAKQEPVVTEVAEEAVDTTIGEEVVTTSDEEADTSVEEASVEEVTTSEVEVEDNVVFTADYQLKVHEYRVFNLVGDATKFIIENLGGGDIYADTKVIEVSPLTRVNDGEPVTFEIAEEDRAEAFLYVTSASRPSFRVTLAK
jgi:cold shock CspA family protein